MVIERRDLTRDQADGLIRMILDERSDARIELVPEGSSLWTVRYELPEAAEAAGATIVNSEPAEPRWLAIARGQLGVRELGGPEASNPVIEGYFATTTGGPRPDDVPWCGAFVSFCLAAAGSNGKGSARAADWLDWGVALDTARRGCVTVLSPQSPGASGHVGFWVGEEGDDLLLLGGNQGNEVGISRYRKADVRGLRWPA